MSYLSLLFLFAFLFHHQPITVPLFITWSFDHILNYYGKPLKILSRDAQGSALLRLQFKRAAWLDIAEQELDQWFDIMED